MVFGNQTVFDWHSIPIEKYFCLQLQYYCRTRDLKEKFRWHSTPTENYENIPSYCSARDVEEKFAAALNPQRNNNCF